MTWLFPPQPTEETMIRPRRWWSHLRYRFSVAYVAVVTTGGLVLEVVQHG